MTSERINSLQLRLLIPLLLAAGLAAVMVSLLSFYWGRQRTLDLVQQRFDGVQRTLQESSFPITADIARSVAGLTDCEIIVCGIDGEILVSTIDVPGESLELSEWINRQDSAQQKTIDGATYLFQTWQRIPSGPQRDTRTTVITLYSSQRVQQAAFIAATPSLITGLTTILVLTTLVIVITGRLVRRLGRLNQTVHKVAAGAFADVVADPAADELGQLSRSVQSMAQQLDQLWKAVNREQGQKLIHQLASGLAHQLRNTLTGARMAAELHLEHCGQNRSEIEVAVQEIENAESYVHRLLLLSAGKQINTPQSVTSCLQSVATSSQTIANHLNVELSFSIADGLRSCSVADGPTFSAAISNLALNAIQVADCVSVIASETDPGMLQVIIRDNGPGIPDSIADEVFEPFVTSKPEGLGLGLPLVRRVAQDLGGQVQWVRKGEETEFHFSIPVRPEDAPISSSPQSAP